MVSKEENDSIWLFDVLDIIGANDEFRMSCQRANIIHEILMTFQNPTSMYLFGSGCEGSFTPGHEQDADFIECDERFPVIEDISRASNQYKTSLLVLSEIDTPVGYVKLQLVIKGTRQTVIHWPYLQQIENDRNVWEKQHLFHCVKLCIKKMLNWVKGGFCPNYFIPGDNLFDGKLNDNRRLKAEYELENILNMGFSCFLHVKSNDICNYVESRKSLERSKRLRSHNQMNEEYIKIIPSLCFCKFKDDGIARTVENMLNTSISDVVMCICFLPSELAITPHAMKFEMFRYFGINLQENEKANMLNRWHYRVVCDCNTFFVFLKHLIKLKLGKVTEACDALKI
ncbi:unnamed protein product [Mytilus edulis]|uniref:Mab-21-like HhH/H2TH-like domain-containing protein n=1 Tax=Mytilus edulis TaxID=6550 RepID=A0A8S3Q4I2_MYTED|nr:unnamed protein product [Mytilus edulis]